MKLAALLFTIALPALAQSVEIRGLVIELGPNVPVPGAEVTLFEFTNPAMDARVFQTVLTDAKGVYSFKPNHRGDFRLEVRHPGYIPAIAAPGRSAGETYKLQMFVPEGPRVFEQRVTLVNPATLTGRVVDEDRNPLAKFPVFVLVENSPYGTRGVSVVTNDEGVFTATGLTPGPYLVRIDDASKQDIRVTEYSEEEFKIVDEGFETSYWPGGVPDLKSALPLVVPPGAASNVGTLTARKASFYRASVEVAGGCTAGDWTYSLIPLPSDPRITRGRPATAPCSKRVLLRNLAPGTYNLAMASDEKESIRSGLTPLAIIRENIEARIALSPPNDLTVRFITADGSPLPRFPETRVLLVSQDAPANGGDRILVPSADGVALARNLPWPRYSVSVLKNPVSHYIKEFRYNQQPMTDAILTLVPGAHLDVVLGDRPASVVGTLTGDSPLSGRLVQLDRWSPVRAQFRENSEPYSYFVQVNASGKFEILGLAPGEYRIRGIAGALFAAPPSEGEKLTLGTDEQKTVELKLK